MLKGAVIVINYDYCLRGEVSGERNPIGGRSMK